MGPTDARILIDQPVHDAASILLIRDPGANPRILMGQRGRHAVFMPDKFVFPGGRVDKGDATVRLAADLGDTCRRRLEHPGGPHPDTLVAAAIRELKEETGQILGRCDPFTAQVRHRSETKPRKTPAPLRYVFRAITPPGQPRRFDARFFCADAADLSTDPDDFSEASDELRHLQWVSINRARALDLPFVTRAVLAHVAERLPRLGPFDTLPFFRDGDEARAKARMEQGFSV